MSKAVIPSFGQKLREARRRQGLSLVVVASSLGVSHGAVAKWEKDRSRPRLKRILALARVLRISPALLLNSPQDAPRDPLGVLRRAQARLAKAWNVPREAVVLTARRADGDRPEDFCELRLDR